jgi:hypothetical protein
MIKMSQLIRFLCLLAILLAVPTGQASAALRSCRTDPIFKLSDGAHLTVAVEIETDKHNLKNIHYILHVPAGVTVTHVTYTAGGRKEMIETFEVRQDSPANTYTVDTLVTTHTPGRVAATVYTRLNGGIKKSLSGYSGQHLIIALASR